MATGSLYGSSSESTGLYGIGAASGGTYFEWFIFQDALNAPATPTGGSWSFSSNTGTAPTGWVVSPPPAPVNQVWVSIAVVDTRSPNTFTWSAPGLMASSGLPILTAAGVPSAGTGANGQLYIDTSATPQSLYEKQAGAWVQLTGSTLYATAGANTNVTSLTGITGAITTPNHVSFDLTPTEPTNEGALYWDTADGAKTLSVVMSNGVVQPIGEKQYYRIKASSAITKGQVTMFTGSVGNSGVLTAAPAFGLTAATAYAVMGIATENIALNNFGYVASFGVVKQVNTSAFADGQILYLNPSVAGGLTATLPTAPNPKVQVCAVVKSATNGQLFVRPSFGGTFGQYEGDVDVSGVLANNLLRRNSGNTKWEPIAGPVGAVVGTTDTQTLTNKTINAASNTLSNIPNSALVYDSVNVNGVDLTLGAVQTLGPDWILPSYVGNAGKVLAINSSANDVEWIPAAGVGTVTSIDVSGGITGLTTFGGPITAAGTITLGGVLSTNSGGTGAISAQQGLNNLASTTTDGHYLRGNGTNVVMSAIQASDVPTLNQNTTGNAATATTATNVSGGTASVTTLTTSSTVTLNGGTANGVAYLNGSKVLTTGSALTYNGTTLTPSATANGANVEVLKLANIGSGDNTQVSVGFYAAGTKYSEIIGGYSGNASLKYNALTTGGYHQWQVNSSEQMRLTSTGLGIGTSSPPLKLSLLSNVSTNNTSTPLVMLGSDRTDYYASINSVRGSASTFLGLSFSTSNNAAPAEVMRLDSSGNLGIGTTSPAVKLDVAGTYRAQIDPSNATFYGATLTLAGDNGTNQSGVRIVGGFEGGFGMLFQTSTTTQAGLSSNPSALTYTTKMRLDSSGNLGLGVTPSAWNSAIKALQIGAGVSLESRASDASYMALSTNQWINSGGSQLYIGSGAAAKYDQTGGQHRWFNAPSGTAGAAITFTQAMTLTASSELNVDSGTGGGRLTFTPGASVNVLNSTTTGFGAYSTLRSRASDYQWYIGGSAEQMRLTTNGDLGIGTSTPNRKLEVGGTSNALMGFNSTSNRRFTIGSESRGFIVYDDTAAAYRLELNASGNLGLGVTPSASTIPQFQSTYGVISGNSEAHIAKNATFNSGWKYVATSTAVRYAVGEGGGADFRWYQAASGTAGNAITFTQAMTLDASGNLLVGATTAPSASVSGIRIGPSSGTTISSSGAVTTAYNHWLFSNGNGTVGSIQTNGSATAYNTSSDYRLKNITGPITTSGAYIDSLNPVEGTWKADGSTFVGLIAHEVQEASRTPVATGVKDGEEMQGMDYSSSEIIANLIAEVKALRTRVAALESI